MTLTFSPQPGPRERQLQRKYGQPLFGDACETVTQELINTAQRQDHSAFQQFVNQFRELVQQAVRLDRQVESDVVLLLKAQLEQQYAVCSGLSGNPKEIKEAIKKLVASISSTLKASAQNDTEALEKFAKDDEHTELHFQLCEFELVSDILNPDDIIPESEQLPTLLLATPESLQAVLMLLPPDKISTLVQQAEKLIADTAAAGHEVSHAEQNLARMRHWLQAQT